MLLDKMGQFHNCSVMYTWQPYFHTLLSTVTLLLKFPVHLIIIIIITNVYRQLCLRVSC